MDLWARIDAERAACDVLRHPFYERWTVGTLTAAELAHYASEYRHAVVALAECAQRAAELAPPHERAQLAEHAAQERSHVALWDGFAQRVGAAAERGSAQNEETRACAEVWSCGEATQVAECVAALYAIEAGQPAVSRTKLDGLRRHYGIDDRQATAYFRLHATLDVTHASSGRALLDRLREAGEVDEDALVRRAASVLEANWRLLDGVQAG